jgi:hypothetical protein
MLYRDGTVSCEQCGYWDRYKDDKGHCRFSPPAIIVHLRPIGHTGAWPTTTDKDWCARWCPTPEEIKRRIKETIYEGEDTTSHDNRHSN